MKRHLSLFAMFAVLVLAGCGGGGDGSLDDSLDDIDEPEDVLPLLMETGKDSLTLALNFNKKGCLMNLVGDRCVKQEDIATFVYSSDSVGWNKESLARAPATALANEKVVLPNTLETDQGTLSVELTDQTTVWFSQGEILCLNVVCEPVKLPDGTDLLRYGDFKGLRITMTVNSITVEWDTSDQVWGFRDPAGTRSIVYRASELTTLRWQSDRAGWNKNSLAPGLLTKSPEGKLRLVISFATIAGETGSFTAERTDGALSWLNLDNRGIVCNGCVIDHPAGQPAILRSTVV
jgi:hypothetical protein